MPYEEMIFFDDWDQNCKDVGKLGVTCVECRRVRQKQLTIFARGERRKWWWWWGGGLEKGWTESDL